MNTTNVSGSNLLRIARRAEIALYALAAIVLIGKIFSFTAPFTQQDSLAVLLGEALGIMASCAASPITTVLASWLERNSPVLNRVVASATNILPFARSNGSADRTSTDADDERRRAA